MLSFRVATPGPSELLRKSRASGSLVLNVTVTEPTNIGWVAVFPGDGALRALALHGFKLDPGEDHDVLVGGAADETLRLAARDALDPHRRERCQPGISERQAEDSPDEGEQNEGLHGD